MKPDKKRSSDISSHIRAATLIAALAIPAAALAQESSVMGVPWTYDKGLGFGSAFPTIPDGLELEMREAMEKRQSAEKIDLRGDLPENKGLNWTFRLQNDYGIPDGDAKPAQFSWTKDAGSQAIWEADAAVRIDLWMTDTLYNPDGREASISFGAEWDKGTRGADEVNRHTYHLGLTMAAFKDNLAKRDDIDQLVQIGVSYTQDEITGMDTWDWGVDWQPATENFVVPIGMRSYLDGTVLKKNETPSQTYYYVRPVVGFAYGDQVTFGEPIATVEDDWALSYQIRAGLGFPFQLNERMPAGAIELSYSYEGGVTLGGEKFNYHEALLSIIPNSNSPASVNFSYLRGNDGFGQPDIDRFRAGIGIQF